MNEDSGSKNLKGLYWGGYVVLSIFIIFHGAILLSFLLSLGVKEFEGARDITFVLLLPVTAIVILIIMVVLFAKNRNKLPSLKRILIVLLVLNVVCFGILEFADGGIGIRQLYQALR